MNESEAFYAEKYRLQAFEKNSIRANKYIAQAYRENDEVVAVFDIGTKAARVLFGRKRIPKPNKQEWHPYAFFNDGQVFNLGGDINPFTNKLDVEKSFALEGVLYLINHYLEKLSKAHVPIDNITLTGTAVFRWLANKEEVLNYIKLQTGVDLIILHPRTEAFCSSLSILSKYRTKKLSN